MHLHRAGLAGLFLLTAPAVPAFVTSAWAATPPIDCKRAKTAVDKTICGSPEYVAMDREIAALYDRSLASSDATARHEQAQNQLAFLKRRRGCDWAAHHSAHPGVAIEECVRGAMDDRVRALRRVVDRPGL